MVREVGLKLAEVDGAKNVADALSKSVPAPMLEKHREYLLGTRRNSFASHPGGEGSQPSSPSSRDLWMG
eukprot:3229762-Rhodomonas_salina.1